MFPAPWSRLCAALAVAAAAGAASAQPANDTCANATPVSTGAITGTTAGATNDGQATCGASASSADVYYVFSAPATCTFEVTTCDGGTFYDSVVSVHSACPATTGNQITCNDDTCGLLSRVTFAGTAGTPYIIRVSGFNGSVGNFTLAVRQLGRPANDTCLGAIPIGGAGGGIAGDTSCAIIQSSFSCVGNASPGVYYRWVAPFTGTATFDTCAAASYDTAITVSTGCPASSLNQIACNDDSCGLRSSVAFPIIAGTEYFVRVAGFGTARGTFSLTYTSVPGPGVNDDCTGAYPVSNGIFQGSTVGAAPSPAGCFNTPDVFYLYRSPANAIVTVTTCPGANYDTVLSAHSACPADGTNLIACNDDACGLQSRITFWATPGTDYFIRVAGFSGAGNFTLQIQSQVDAIALDPSTLGEYYLIPPGGTITDFRNYAAGLSSYLASAASFSEAQFINSVASFGNNHRGAAIGLSDEANENSFLWDDGSPFAYSFWNRGEPNNASNEDYTHIVDPVTGVWNDYNGSAVVGMAAVAESDRAELARVIANGRAYILFKASSWEGAAERARAMGGYLVTINNAAENEFVRANLANAGGTPRTIWIGFNDAAQEGAFSWTGENSAYTNWGGSEPNNLGNEDYGTMNPKNGLWNDIGNISFGNPVFGVAEIPLPVVITSAFRGAAGCDAFVVTSATNWYPAQILAESLGGTLASIHSPAQNEFIRANIAIALGHLWIGGTDRDNEGHFSWTDGSPFNYSAWAPGEPNNAGITANEDYIEMGNPFNGEWNDLSTRDAVSFSLSAVISFSCPCDWNASGNINSQDFFDFLSAFFTGNGDFNCDSVNNSQDFFDFLACFFNPPVECQ
jgi:hypothetical protein